MPTYDDWIEGVYRLIIAHSRGALTDETLEQWPVEKVLQLAETLIDLASVATIQ